MKSYDIDQFPSFITQTSYKIIKQKRVYQQIRFEHLLKNQKEKL